MKKTSKRCTKGNRRSTTGKCRRTKKACKKGTRRSRKTGHCRKN